MQLKNFNSLEITLNMIVDGEIRTIEVHQTFKEDPTISCLTEVFEDALRAAGYYPERVP